MLLSLFTKNSILAGILKIRGVLRLLRIFLLIRKLNALKVKRDMTTRSLIGNGYDIRSPLEKVLEILNILRDSVDLEEVKII